jgi:predicted nucleotidyltransferase
MSGIPCANQSVSPLEELAGILDCHWKNIEDARKSTRKALQGISEIIENTPRDTSIVVHGSLARYECTQGSDLDWTLLVDGVADPAVQNEFIATRKKLSGNSRIKDLGLKDPGREKTFGTLSFSQPMIHYIGGEEDTNANTTRRILLLLEAQPIGDQSGVVKRGVFNQVRMGILRRYLDEDRGLLKLDLEGKRRWVPLFLLNDFARYWRTMAVDFAYKQFDRGNQGYALRSIKLGTSRKLLFASGLLACFWCDPVISKNPCQEVSKQSLMSNLADFLELTPLERVALFYTKHIGATNSEFLKKNANELFGAYDEFLGKLNEKEWRDRLENLQLPKTEEVQEDEVFKQARIMRKEFSQAILDMFVNQDSPLRKHSIEKGIF